jgi:D-alanine--D-alanine ligase
MDKVKLAILYGGPGDEHEVSVKSAKNILENIDKEKYDVLEFLLPKKSLAIPRKILKLIKKGKFLVWPIFHGVFGEGGQVQSVLEKNRIKYIGSSSKVSRVGIDKFSTQKVLEKNKIRCPRSIVVRSATEGVKKSREKKLLFPLILKPVNGGSSLDLYKVTDVEGLGKNLKKIFQTYQEFLMQEFVEGREFTCGVIDMNRKRLALPVSEVVLTKGSLFDYSAKYTKGGCIEVTPARVDVKVFQKLQKVALKVHKTVGCKGVSRTDMILDKKGRIFVLEVNTIPGMTKMSFVPQQLLCFGISIPKFIDILIHL